MDKRKILFTFSLLLGISVLTLFLFKTSISISNKNYNLKAQINSTTNNLLTNITVTDHNLNESFSSSTFMYTVNVSNETLISDINIEATLNDQNDNVYIDYPDELVSGSNEVYIYVYSNPSQITYDGSSIKEPVEITGDYNKYTVDIIKAAGVSPGLLSISVDNGTLSPEFDQEVFLYNSVIPANVNFEELEIDTTSTDGVMVEIVRPIEYNLVRNVFDIVVTIDENTTKTYKVTVVKDVDNLLLSMDIVGATLTEEFDPYNNLYFATAGDDVTSISFTNLISSTGSTIGPIIGNAELVDGDNIYEITVSSPLGDNKYTIVVKKGKSNINTLQSILINNGDYNLNPAFNPNINGYTVIVPNNVDTINIDAIKSDSYETVNGLGDKELQVGSNNLFEIEVLSEDNTPNTYVVRVTRQESIIIPGVVDGTYLLVELSKTVGDIKTDLNTYTVNVYDTDDSELENSTLIRTNHIIQVNDSRFIIFIKGDFKPDGKVNINDIQRLYDYLFDESFNTSIVSEAEKKAGEMTNDSKLNINDVQKLYDTYMSSMGGE